MLSSKITLQLNKTKSNSSSRKHSIATEKQLQPETSLSQNMETGSDELNDQWSAESNTQFEYYMGQRGQKALPRRATIIPYITLTNESPLLNPDLLTQEKMFGTRAKRSGMRYPGGSRGSLPFTPSLKIPEAIPEVVMPRRYSTPTTEKSTIVGRQSDNSNMIQPAGSDSKIAESQRPARSYSPLRASDLVVPCSNTFEQVLKNMEREHAHETVYEED